jgi:WD40 repeat protein
MIRIWNAGTGNCDREIDTCHPHGVGRIEISPDGRWIATIGSEPQDKNDQGPFDGSVRIWETRTGKLLRRIETSSHWVVRDFRILPDGATLVTAGRTSSQRSNVTVWRADTGEANASIESSQDIDQVVVLGNGKWLAIKTARDQLGLWQRDGSPDTAIRINGYIKQLIALPSDDALCVWTQSGLNVFRRIGPH